MVKGAEFTILSWPEIFQWNWEVKFNHLFKTLLLITYMAALWKLFPFPSYGSHSHLWQQTLRRGRGGWDRLWEGRGWMGCRNTFLNFSSNSDVPCFCPFWISFISIATNFDGGRGGGGYRQTHFNFSSNSYVTHFNTEYWFSKEKNC